MMPSKFFSINSTNEEKHFVLLLQSSVTFLNKISKISLDGALNIDSIIGCKIFHLHKDDFPKFNFK